MYSESRLFSKGQYFSLAQVHNSILSTLALSVDKIRTVHTQLGRKKKDRTTCGLRESKDKRKTVWKQKDWAIKSECV